MKQGALLYPRHRVLQLQSPNPYEPVLVFSYLVSSALNNSDTDTDK